VFVCACFLLRTALLLAGCSEFQKLQHVGFTPLLESEPAGPLLSRNIHEWSNKSVIQAGRTAVCSYMRCRVEVGSSPDWEDVDVAMTNSIQGVAQTHFKVVQCMFFLNAQTA